MKNVTDLNVDLDATANFQRTVLEEAVTSVQHAIEELASEKQTAFDQETAADSVTDDSIAELARDFESKLRDYVQNRLVLERSRYKEQMSSQIETVRASAVLAVKKQVDSIRNRYKERYNEKSQLLQSQKDRLIALASQVTEQKDRLTSFKTELEDKARAVERLHTEVTAMCSSLAENVGGLEGVAEKQGAQAAELDEIMRAD